MEKEKAERTHLFVVIDGDSDRPGAAGLIGRVVEVRHVWVPQRIRRSEALGRVEHQQLLQKVRCVTRCLGKDGSHILCL